MERIDNYLNEIKTILDQVSRAAINGINLALWETYNRDRTIFVCGNGGSAATASHFALDLSKWTITEGHRRLRAHALTDSTPMITAWANDNGYDRVFVEQLKTWFRPGDTIVAISGSGNSPNVLRAVEWANHQGAVTIGMTGFDGGELATLVDIGLVVPCHMMTQIEDVHMIVCSALAVNLAEMISGG